MTEYKEWSTKDGNKYSTDLSSSVTFWAIHAEYAKPAWKSEEPIPDGACYPTPVGAVPFYVYWDDFLLDEAVRLAEEKGLDPEYTRLFILTSINELSGGSYPKKVVK